MSRKGAKVAKDGHISAFKTYEKLFFIAYAFFASFAALREKEVELFFVRVFA